MGMPHFPNIRHPAPQREIIDRLLETIALEELALAHLINAEAEKLQAVVEAGIIGPISPEDVRDINLGVKQVLEEAGRKEERLRRKLSLILAHKEHHKHHHRHHHAHQQDECEDE